MGDEVVLAVKDLVSEFRTEHGRVRAVDRVSFALPRGKTMAVVGESGCGKSVTALSIMRLIPDPPGRIAGGEVVYRGTNLLALAEREMRRIRGNQISMIFQEPMTSLNPVFTAGEQVAEAIRLHQRASRRAALEGAVEMFRRVGIPSPEERIRSYPHQMSGGMRQRVMIAMALACRPDVLIADEPTTALDVTIQAQILDLLARLQRDLGMSIMLITHDLGIVAETSQEVVVMYAGRVIERAPTADLFAAPRHPYTAALMQSLPSCESPRQARRGDEGAGAARAGTRPGAPTRPRLREIPGRVPALHQLPPGCKFQDRCHLAQAICRGTEPELEQIGASWVRCHFPLSLDSRP